MSAPIPPTPGTVRLLEAPGVLSRRALWTLLGAIAVGCALRLGWVLWLHPPAKFIYSDMLSYVNRAKALRTWQYSDFDWMYPPGTSMWLTLAMLVVPKHWETAAGVLQALLSTLEIPLVFI